MPEPSLDASRNGPPASMAPAPWLDQAQVVHEVHALREQFSAADLSVSHMLCDRHPAADTAFIVAGPSLQLVALSYGELAERSRRLASALAARGVSRGARVGVLMSKGLQMPVVALALWRLGAVYVPLFTAFAGPSIALRVNAASAVLVIADVDQLHKLDGLATPVLESGDTLERLMADHELLARDVAVGADGVFLQLYTSGTTGAPKGVAVPAFAMASFMAYSAMAWMSGPTTCCGTAPTPAGPMACITRWWGRWRWDAPTCCWPAAFQARGSLA